ncbi:MAG: BrnA antitoxin family protein [Deltaproteobacteria bacterium]|nr:BrnA antitoxin family protein [Deltaproteobacteria bacterium]
MRKNIPRVESKDAEREFWASHDSAEHLDWSKAEEAVLAELKPTVRTISLRLPASMIEQLELLAHKRDVPYPSLLKIFLSERIRDELRNP